MGALALILADCLPIDSYIRPIAPVLMDTIWMSIHVPEIMVSYSVLAIAVLVAHVQVVVMAAAPRSRHLITSIDRLHFGYVRVGAWLLAMGIITGSMWGASSWGRYWGWDPKEVWSLVALLGYVAILHVRANATPVRTWMVGGAAALGAAVLVLVVRPFGPASASTLGITAGMATAMVFFVATRGIFAAAVKSILAFWLIIMTYVGVNYVLGVGLHSYAFGTGAVVRYLFIIGGADLLLIGFCALVYGLRRGQTGPTGIASSV
jgi:ABC-type transport system involved in cytochrome c biogenesis permease subunit